MVGPSRLNIVLDGQPEEVGGFPRPPTRFAALGTQPELGRALHARRGSRGQRRVIVISHEFWQTRLGGRRDVLGPDD